LGALLLLAAVASWLILRERRRCRREVEQARDRYRSILENAPDAVALFDDHFRVIEWNTAAERLYGISRQDAVGKALATVPLERWNELRELLGRVARDQLVQDYESERLRADGARIPVALSYARMPAVTGRPPLHREIAQDIRERLKMRDKLLEVEKLTLTGRVAAGTAHHLNTPLTAMLLETEMLAVRLKDREGVGELAQIKDRILIARGLYANCYASLASPSCSKSPCRCVKLSERWQPCCVLALR
jgi:PAS domain S-box-containing protein